MLWRVHYSTRPAACEKISAIKIFCVVHRYRILEGGRWSKVVYKSFQRNNIFYKNVKNNIASNSALEIRTRRLSQASLHQS